MPQAAALACGRFSPQTRCSININSINININVNNININTINIDNGNADDSDIECDKGGGAWHHRGTTRCVRHGNATPVIQAWCRTATPTRERETCRQDTCTSGA